MQQLNNILRFERQSMRRVLMKFIFYKIDKRCEGQSGQRVLRFGGEGHPSLSPIDRVSNQESSLPICG